MRGAIKFNSKSRYGLVFLGLYSHRVKGQSSRRKLFENMEGKVLNQRDIESRNDNKGRKDFKAGLSGLLVVAIIGMSTF